MKKIFDPIKFLKKLEEEDTDVVTLFNLIGTKDARNKGFSWVSLAQGGKPKTMKNVFEETPKHENIDGDYDLDKILEEKVEKSQQNTPPPIVNSRDPNMFSSFPEYNPCPGFLDFVCRVDGKPCIYTINDYKSCGKFSLASGSVDPNLMQIPVGRENDMAYVMNYRA